MAAQARNTPKAMARSAGRSVGTQSQKVRENAARREVIAVAQQMSARGLSPGRSGNVSRRWAQGMLITPSGMAYDSLKPADVVFVAPDGSVPAKARKPSSEWRFHLAAYAARADRYAIVHTHSLNATVLACRHQAIPAFHYMVAIAGGKEIPCVPYAAFGTTELASFVADGLEHHDACLMANHGQIAIGDSAEQALELASEVEILATQFVRVLSLGKPKLLSDSEMDEVLVRFQNYGQSAQTSSRSS